MRPKTIVGIFDSGPAVLAAALAARQQGLSVRDCYTPFPVHGMDEALGLEPSWLSRACLGLAVAGLAAALSFQYWVSLFDWPMNIGGKPFDASPALIPIAFEITVLVSGVGTVLTLLIYRGLLPGRKPEAAGLGATDDKFLLVVEGSSETALRDFYRQQGAVGVEELGGDRR